MDKNEGASDPWSETNDDAEEIRVTDRRRIHLGENGKVEANAAAEISSLKPSYVEELEARTKAAEKLVHEVQSRFEQLRKQLQRETDETRVRLNRAADERAQREKADFIAALLPVLDNLQRATEAAETGGAPDIIAEGVRRTAASFENALSVAGVEAIVSVGQPFDPGLHEAVDTIEVRPEMDRKVIAEYAPGYRIGDRLLRPARVKVGRAFESLGQAGK